MLRWLGVLGWLAMVAHAAAQAPASPTPQTAIPAHNAKDLAQAPPLPGLGDAPERARLLVAAIVADDPARAQTMFLPREAFRVIKAIRNPDALYDRLWRAYERDIHALHARLGKDAQVTFVRLELSRRREWVRIGGEANLLPYWAQRHNTLVLRVNDKEVRIELRVLIAWDDRWYITHLSEFKQMGKAH